MDIPEDGIILGIKVAVKAYKKCHNIKVSQSDSSKHDSVVAPSTTFAELVVAYPNFCKELLKNLDQLSFTLPTPIQAQAIPVMLKHYHLIACAPTGSGKTAAYLLPMLQQFVERLHQLKEVEGPTEKISPTFAKMKLFGLILVPTQELGRQIWSEATRLSSGLSEHPIIACLNRRHYKDPPKADKEEENISSSHKHHRLRLPSSVRFVISTPSRIGQLLSLSDAYCPFDLSELHWLVIDECDKMLEIDQTGNSNKQARQFRDQLTPVFTALREAQQGCEPKQRTAVALFSATIPEEVAGWARNELSMELMGLKQSEVDSSNFVLTEVCVGVRNSAAPTVHQELRYCGSEEGKLIEIRSLLVRGLTYPCLIFMESRKRADDIVKEIGLFDASILIGVISSEKTVAQRFSTIRDFREGKINVLVCTNVIGRGIDFKHVSMVVNYDLPSSREEYIHRVGRTGRAGEHGRAISLWTDADLPHLADIIKVMRRSGSVVDSDLERLVVNWESRKRQLINTKKKSKHTKTSVKALMISKRRGERRLAKKIFKSPGVPDKPHAHLDTSRDASGDNTESVDLPWLRRWNPHRKSISDLSNARQKKM